MHFFFLFPCTNLWRYLKIFFQPHNDSIDLNQYSCRVLFFFFFFRSCCAEQCWVPLLVAAGREQVGGGWQEQSCHLLLCAPAAALQPAPSWYPFPCPSQQLPDCCFISLRLKLVRVRCSLCKLRCVFSILCGGQKLKRSAKWCCILF